MSVRSNVPHFVYRYYDADGNLLYVGCTNTPYARREGHSRDSSWFPKAVRARHTVYPDRATALARESLAIHEEKPRHNVKGRWRRGFSRDHWVIEDYHAFLWATIDAAVVVTPNTRHMVAAIVREARDRFGVTLMGGVAA